MAKHPVILIDDPRTNTTFDLQRPLRGWRGGLAAVVTPVGEPSAEGAESAQAPYAGKNDSHSTRVLKHADVRYTLVGKRSGEREFRVAECAEVFAPWASEEPILVGFVSYATTPLLVALAHADAFRDALRVGVSGVRLDTQYNLARKLIVDGLIHYHEHTLALEKVLNSRLALMLQAHQERRRAGSA